MANGFCYRHNPEISDESKREASKRGGAKFDPRAIAETYEPIKGQTLGDLQDALLRNANDLRAGKIDARTSNAVVQNIIALIEDNFDLMLDPEDIIACTSYNSAKEILSKYNVEI